MSSRTVKPNGGKRPTMREVAALAGVGIKTVSRVVNGEDGVSTVLRRRVQAAIGQLDYHRDLNASLLRRTERRTATIGLILDDVGNPFSSTLNRAVEDFAHERGVLVFTGSCDEDKERERELVATLQARRVDGILLVPAGAAEHSYLLTERRAGTALVFVDRPARLLDADSVTSDNVSGAALAVGHLADAGHRRIAHLGDDPAISTAADRRDGYRAEVARRGLDADASLVRTGIRSAEEAARATTDLLQGPSPPTALFTSQNLVTMGAVRALRALGLEQRVALVGFDDFLLADLLQPGVTVVSQDPTRMGREAAELLFARIDGDASPSRHVVIDVTLVARGSGEIRPARQRRR